MSITADDIDEIVSNVVSEAEAHALAERHKRSFGVATPSDPTNVTWTGACGVKGPADAYPLNTSAIGGDDLVEVQQPLSANVSPDSALSDNNSSFRARAYSSSNAFAQQQASEWQQARKADTDSAEGLLGKADVPESVAKNSKLLALKQRRLGSLSSSLDLSRESSFDSASHALLDDNASTPQNSFAGLLAHNSTSAMHTDTELNEQASIPLAPLPLDSTTGTQTIAFACACTILLL